MKTLLLFSLLSFARAEQDKMLFFIECYQQTGCKPVSFEGETVNLLTEPDFIVGDEQVTSATYDHTNEFDYDDYSLTVDLTPEAGAQLEELTKRNVQKKMAVVFNGKVLMAPIIRERIPGGRFKIQNSKTIRSFWEDIPWLKKKVVDLEAKAVQKKRLKWILFGAISGSLVLAMAAFLLSKMHKKT